MVSIKRVKNESRERDEKRGRFLLSIGLMEYHISEKEARKLFLQLSGLLTTNKNSKL